MLAQFSLRDEGLVAVEDVFDGVFQSDDPFTPFFGSSCQQARDGGRFSTAGDAGDDDEPLIHRHELFPSTVEGEAHFFRGWNVAGEHPQSHTGALAGTEDIDAEGEIFLRPLPGSVDILSRIDPIEGVLAQGGFDESLNRVVVEVCTARQGNQFSIEPVVRRLAGSQVQIADAQDSPGEEAGIGESVEQVEQAPALFLDTVNGTEGVLGTHQVSFQGLSRLFISCGRMFRLGCRP